MPKFTELSKKTVQSAELSPNKVRELRTKKLNDAVHIHEDRLHKNKYKFDTALNQVKFSPIGNLSFKKIRDKIEYKIRVIEMKRDLRRSNMLEKMINTNNFEPSKINIYNETNIEIPPNVQKILQFGLQHPIGSKPKPLITLTAIEQFLKHWRPYAESIGIDELTILNVRAKLFCHFGELSSCYTDTSKTKELTTFLQNNPEIVLVPIDKTRDITIMLCNDYKQKLNNIFSDTTKFDFLTTDPLPENLIACRKSLKKMEPYLSKTSYQKMLPLESLKKSYGTIKRHKIGKPVRPIVSSIDSVTSGAEAYIQKIINPLADKCKFSVNSTKSFKEQFFKNINKFRYYKT